MASPTRRSPRTLTNFLNGDQIPDFSQGQSILVYSLAHCTGWSAERISHNVQSLTTLIISPEAVWDSYNYWIANRIGGETMTEEDLDVMKYVLKNDVGIEWQGVKRPLTWALRPIVVEFAAQWSAKDPLFEGYTPELRNVIKSYLMGQTSYAAVGNLTPMEKPLAAKFGDYVFLTIVDLLKKWSREVKTKLRNEPLLSSLNTWHHGYVTLIFEYLKSFQDSYEFLYGELDDTSEVAERVDKTRVTISSTGYGIKAFLGIMMADRLWVIDLKRKRQAAEIAFLELHLIEVPEGAGDCPICQDRMGVPSAEGEIESPLKMVICCGQIIGKECLKRWLTEQDTCPVCRHAMPDSFTDKLFGYVKGEEMPVANHANGEDVLAEQLSAAIVAAVEVPARQLEIQASITVDDVVSAPNVDPGAEEQLNDV